MNYPNNTPRICVVIGASHAGVNCAFALRKTGWEGKIILFDSDPHLPYHRPPLSKSFLSHPSETAPPPLRPQESYEKANITLCLGITVQAIDRQHKFISLEDGTQQSYDTLVIATGARPWIPSIPGIDTAINAFPLRTANDALQIREALKKSALRRVVIIGGGYIGLETAASLRQLDTTLTILERESRILARVTAPALSNYFHTLHEQKGVNLFTGKQILKIEADEECALVHCSDGTQYIADLLIVGTGIQVNTELARNAGLEVKGGIHVDERCRTNDEHIFAIGDCTYHVNARYAFPLRLESVQNAVDQGKVAAAAICGKPARYDRIPWFWSDQYDVKLQMVGLSEGYDQAIIRRENGQAAPFSIWYFKGEQLLAVDAVNHPKAYVLGTKFIKAQQRLDKTQLANPKVDFKPANFLAKQLQ